MLILVNKFANVVVKGTSWTGHDYLRIGFFAEIALSEKGVRFITINDRVQRKGRQCGWDDVKQYEDSYREAVGASQLRN